MSYGAIALRLRAARGRAWLLRKGGTTSGRTTIATTSCRSKPSIPFSAQTTGAYVLAESYLYTVEAFQDYLSHLTDDGVLSIVSGDMQRSPRCRSPHATRLALVAREAPRRRGVSRPAGPYHARDKIKSALFAFCRTCWSSGSPFTPEEVRRVREFVSGNTAYFAVDAIGRKTRFHG